MTECPKTKAINHIKYVFSDFITDAEIERLKIALDIALKTERKQKGLRRMGKEMTDEIIAKADKIIKNFEEEVKQLNKDIQELGETNQILHNEIKRLLRGGKEMIEKTELQLYKERVEKDKLCGGTAKGSSREDAKVSDEINKLNQRLEIDESSSSQEFPSQKFLYFERCQDGYIEYNIPTNTKIRMVLDKIEFEIEQAREEIIKELQLDTFIRLNKEDMIKFKKWLQLEKEGKE